MQNRIPMGTLVIAALLASGSFAWGAEPVPAPGTAAGTPMKMDEPMPTKMAKPGTKLGDVKRAAEKKDREMKPMMEKESADWAKK